MCTGRVDLAFVLRALQNGADGVIIGGCWPGECHYVTEGNYDALGNLHLGRKLLALIGLAPERFRLEWIAASEGTRFAEVMSDFAATLRALGPLGQREGVPPETLARRLAAVSGLVPYLKLVEREKLRIPAKSEEAYRVLYESEETERLLGRLVSDKLAMSEILGLLSEAPLATGEISERMGLSASEVARHVGAASRLGLLRYDVEAKRYALA